MKTIATINFKGGVGKTTVTWCLGDVLSQRENSNSLLFDLDAQGSLTQAIALGSGDNAQEHFEQWHNKSINIYQALEKFLKADYFDFEPTDRFIYKLRDNYHFIPSTEQLYWLELKKLDPSKGKSFIENLLGRIENSDALPKYDYALFDCPPSFTLLSYSVLACCDLVLVPVNPDFFAAKGVDILLAVLKEGIQPHPLPTIAVFTNRVRESYSPYNTTATGMAPTYAEKRWIEDLKNICHGARERWGIRNVHYLDAYIRGRVAIGNAITQRRTPHQHIGEFIELWKESGGKLK